MQEGELTEVYRQYNCLTAEAVGVIINLCLDLILLYIELLTIPQISYLVKHSSKIFRITILFRKKFDQKV